MKTTYVLKVPINVTSYEEIITVIQKKIEQKQKYCIISINLNKIILANEKNEMMPITVLMTNFPRRHLWPCILPAL